MRKDRNKSILRNRNKKNNFSQIFNRLLESETVTASAARTLLALLFFGGVIVVGAMAPNIFSAFDKLNGSRKFKKKQVQNSIQYLQRKNLVQCIKKEGNATVVTITKDGIQRVRKFVIDELTIEKQLQWDGRWRIVIFDIPEQYRSARRALRNKLKELGFLQLQKSAFVYPYPAEDEILFITAIFEVEEYVEFLTVEKMLHDKKLRKFFKLK
ncbi:MAG: CRISPR-associated endonuclease Cas2 [Candidatus Niyogibacteria bacterium]|nr:CRISPR-associated endonuclease Cas2 [Candidatus Niyogibacteria bacterium]